MPISIVQNIDCVIAMKEFPDKFFDLAVVDPPYGINQHNERTFGYKTSKNKHDISKDWDIKPPNEEYFKELFRVSKNQIICGGNYFLEHLHSTRCFIVWDKLNGENSLADAELLWTSFNTSVRIFRCHIFSGIGNTKYKSIHPTQKPVALYTWLLKKYAKQGDKILDTHLGSGSSRIAAFNLGLDFWGYEIDKDYFDDQEQRFNGGGNKLFSL
jgi:site-specific DNA-methyltransferase (adenine-specific)